MKVQGAYIKEQGVTFAIIMVKPSALHDPERERIRLRLSKGFGGAPVIFAVKGEENHIKYHGRADIVNFLATIPVERIPWKEFLLQ